MSIFLSNEVFVFLVIEIILIVLMAISQIAIIKILKHWDFKSTTALQYHLEKKNYLINTILYFTVTCKIVLFLFFAQSLDSLADMVPGAMCSAGVVGANSYGNFLLLLKLILIFGFGVWLVINKLDLADMTFPYLKRKYLLFTCLFIGIVAEFILEMFYFLNISLQVPVFCCSVVFQAPKLPFGYSEMLLVSLFYLVYGAIILLNTIKHEMATFTCNVLFLFIAYYAITYFFGLYVYEMPNHKCPYCMLKKEYFYIGYFIWSSIFLGIFFGVMPFLVERITGKNHTEFLKYSTLFLSIAVVICSFYVVHYYLKTGTLLG